jgi:hypothetical protein
MAAFLHKCVDYNPGGDGSMVLKIALWKVLAPFLVLFFFLVVALQQHVRLQQEVEARHHERAVLFCEHSNQRNENLAEMLNQLFIVQAQEFEELDEATIAERIERIERLRQTVIADLDCDDIFDGDD